MPGSGLQQVLVAELIERGLDSETLHSFYNNAIDLTTVLMYSFNTSTMFLLSYLNNLISELNWAITVLHFSFPSSLECF